MSEEPGLDLIASSADEHSLEAQDKFGILTRKLETLPTAKITYGRFRSRLESVEKTRVRGGMFLMGLGIAFDGATLVWSLCHLPVTKVDSIIGLYCSIIDLASHALVTVASVWFGYQLVRAGERLLIPLDLVDDARVLLGVSSPTKEFERLFKLISTASDSKK